jgi:hypothetical protein
MGSGIINEFESMWKEAVVSYFSALCRPLGRPRRRWVDNIKIDLREIVWDGVDCSCKIGSFSRRAQFRK